MALYDYQCGACGSVREAYNRIAERETHAPSCCDRPMQIVHLTPPMGNVQCEAHYVCPATGERITSHRQRRNNFARHGLMDANDFTPEFCERRDTKKWERIRALAAEANRDNTAGVTLHDVIEPQAA